MEALTKYLKDEAKSLKRVADNESKKPQLREAWQAKYTLFNETAEMLKDGADRGHVLSILKAMELDLGKIINPTFTEIGRRQAAFTLIRILQED